VLGHPTRMRMLELLGAGEASVGDLQAALGLNSSGTSQHLGVLRRHGLVESRRAGTSIYYRVHDPRVFQLLAVGRQILTSKLVDAQSILATLHEETEESSDPSEPAVPRPADYPLSD